MKEPRLFEAHNTKQISHRCKDFTEAAMAAAGKLLRPQAVRQPSRPLVTAVPFTKRTVAPVAPPQPEVLEVPEFLRARQRRGLK